MSSGAQSSVGAAINARHAGSPGHKRNNWTRDGATSNTSMAPSSGPRRQDTPMSPRPAARCYSPACASPPASRPWRMSRSTTARPWCANASPSTHPSPEPGPAHHRRRTPEPLSPPGPTCPDRQLLRRTPTHQRRRAATLLMQSTAALGNETSQELGGSCANTRDSDIVSPAPSGRGCPIRSVRAAAAQQVGGNCETCSPVRRQFRRGAIRRSRLGLGG